MLWAAADAVPKLYQVAHVDAAMVHVARQAAPLEQRPPDAPQPHVAAELLGRLRDNVSEEQLHIIAARRLVSLASNDLQVRA